MKHRKKNKMNINTEEAQLLGKPSKKSQVKDTERDCRISGKACIVFILGIIVCAALVTGLVITFILEELKVPDENTICQDSCIIRLVESIPENLTYNQNETVHMPTDQALMELVDSAKKSIELVIYYWTLRNNDVPYVRDNSSEKGQLLFDKLMKAGKKGIKLKIVQNVADEMFPQHDSEYLKKYAHADVRTLNVSQFNNGQGILHTKLWLIDRQHFYVGSANADWRSLTQVKEMGVLVQNCSCLATDMAKMFEAYWIIAKESSTVPTVPSTLSTYINAAHPETVTYNNNSTHAQIYLSSSPPNFCPSGRTIDIDAIVSVIRNATRFVYVSVMDYLPLIAYKDPRTFWSVIDDELRRAAIDRHVTVRFLGSNWKHTDPDMPIFLQSLLDINQVTNVNLEVKMFEVPTFTKAQAKIPFSRVNHNKYMVTDKHAYIGTSNWYGDYFVATAGIGFILQPIKSTEGTIDVRQQLENVFLRDWNSQYSHPLNSTFLNNRVYVREEL